MASVPDPAQLIEIRGVTPVELRNPAGARWWPGRLSSWMLDVHGDWYGYAWPEALTEPPYYGRHATPKDAPQGWLPIEQLRPSDHHIPDLKGVVGSLRAVEPWFWPPAD